MDGGAVVGEVFWSGSVSAVAEIQEDEIQLYSFRSFYAGVIHRLVSVQ